MLNKLKLFVVLTMLISISTAGTDTMEGVSVSSDGKTIVSCVRYQSDSPLLSARLQGDAFLLQEQEGIKIKHEELQVTRYVSSQLDEGYAARTHLISEGELLTKQVDQWRDKDLVCVELELVMKKRVKKPESSDSGFFGYKEMLTGFYVSGNRLAHHTRGNQPNSQIPDRIDTVKRVHPLADLFYPVF